MTEIQEKKLKSQINHHLRLLFNAVVLSHRSPSKEVAVTAEDLFNLFKSRIHTHMKNWLGTSALDIRGKALSYPPESSPDPIDADCVILDTETYQRLEKDRLKLFKKERSTDEKIQFHNHPLTEKRLRIDPDHVIIDRSAYEKVIEYQHKIFIDKAAETVGGPLNKGSLCDSCIHICHHYSHLSISAE